MNITDMLVGMKRLQDMGYSDDLIKSVLSSRAFKCESELIAALEDAKRDDAIEAAKSAAGGVE